MEELLNGFLNDSWTTKVGVSIGFSKLIELTV